jgi:glycosyltransferase involved in cell wall biosynthesis
MSESLTPKKKILFVSNDSGTPGAQMSLYHLLKNLDRDKYEAIVTMHRDGPFMEKIRSLGWPVVKLHRIRLTKSERPPLRGLGERMTWWLWKKTRGEKVIRLIERENIDMVHTMSMVCFEGAYAARKTKRPHIWHIHEILPGNRRLFGVFGTRKTLKMITRYADKVVCVSDAAKRQFVGWQRQPEKYITIYDGVDTRLFNPKAIPVKDPVLREEYNIPEDMPIVGYAAKVAKQKGLSDLIDACVLLRQERVNFHLVVFGEIADVKFFYQLGNIIQQAGLEDRIHFLGKYPYENMPGILKQVDIFVSSAHHDPFSHSLIEAMAVGIPVVGTNSGGTPEIIGSNKTGLLAKTGIPGNLAQNIKTLIQDSKKRKQFSKAALEKVESQFAVEQFVESVQQVYDEILLNQEVVV